MSAETSLFSHENKKVLTCEVAVDEFTRKASEAFDFKFDGKIITEVFGKPQIENKFALGLIVGASGSGKSSMLKEFGDEIEPVWDNSKAIISHFATPDEAVEKMGAVGLNSIPTWCKPFFCLSNGEKFRANLARKIGDGRVIDEFTSVVDRNVAVSASVALKRYIDAKHVKGMVLASCHRDIIEWLCPDWVFDTDTGELLVGRFLRRPSISLEIYAAKIGAWKMFEHHHYLTNEIAASARCFLCAWKDIVIGFSAVLPLPSGTVQNSFREHRTVLLPDYQGIGIGVRFSDAIAKIYFNEGKRFFSKTANIRMSGYRDKSPLWKRSASHGKEQSPNKDKRFNRSVSVGRVLASHEYIGENAVQVKLPEKQSVKPIEKVVGQLDNKWVDYWKNRGLKRDENNLPPQPA